MNVDEAQEVLVKNGFIVERDENGYWHYCGNIKGEQKESCYATDTRIKDLATYLQSLE